MTTPIDNDNLDSMLKSDIANEEYFLQGSIIDNAVESLLHKLCGLCSNDFDIEPEPIYDHEMCFSLRKGPPPEQPLSFRVRRALDHKDMPYQLRYVGLTEIGDPTQPTAVRNVIDVATSSNVVEFITELGCRLDFQYVAKGYIFKKGCMKAVVSKIFKINVGANVQLHKRQINEAALNPLTNSYLVELSVLAPRGQTNVGHDLKAFADQLKPLVNLEKVDLHRY